MRFVKKVRMSHVTYLIHIMYALMFQFLKFLFPCAGHQVICTSIFFNSNVNWVKYFTDFPSPGLLGKSKISLNSIVMLLLTFIFRSLQKLNYSVVKLYNSFDFFLRVKRLQLFCKIQMLVFPIKIEFWLLGC